MSRTVFSKVQFNIPHLQRRQDEFGADTQCRNNNDDYPVQVQHVSFWFWFGFLCCFFLLFFIVLFFACESFECRHRQLSVMQAW